MNTQYIAHPKYRPDIQGLRAVAVLLVVAFHAFPGLIPGGFVGVDIFFVISGFLISSIIISNLEKGTFSFLEFYQRRIRRIFPALILVLAACFALGWFALLPDEYQQLGKHLIGGASMTSNFIYWDEAGYFDYASEAKPLLHLWSLGVEEQFYIIWPLLLWFAYRRKFNLLLVIAAVGLSSFALNIALIYEDSTYAFYSPQTRLWEILIGAALSYLVFHKHKVLDSDWCKYSAPAGTLLIITAVVTLSNSGYFPGWWALLPTLGTALLIFAGVNSWVNRTILSNKIMVGLGAISYPLYLWHWPLLSFAHIVEGGTPAPHIRIACVSLAIVLAWATFRLLEVHARFRAIGNLPPKLAALMLVVGVAGGAAYFQNGFATRSNVVQYASYSSQLAGWERELHNSFCHPYFSSYVGMCWMAKNAEPTILLLGDSHAYHLYPGLLYALRDTQENVMSLSVTRCLPFMIDANGTHRRKCTADANLKFAAEHESVRTVVMAAKWDSYISGNWWYDSVEDDKLPAAAQGDGADDTERARTFTSAMRGTIKYLLSKRKKIVWVLDVAEPGFNPKSCIRRPLTLSHQEIRATCAVPRKEFEEKARLYRKLVLSVLKDFPSVQVFDAAPVFCDDAWCWAAKDDDLFYRDGNHLSTEGSRRVAKELVKVLQARPD